MQVVRDNNSLSDMIKREITGRLTQLFGQYPFVTVTGPRQSGKTTLCRTTFPNLEYVNLEAPDLREFAESDPRGFLSRFRDGVIIDEIQHVPALLSYLQVLADERGRNSLFVLTGSEEFRISHAISQSLAGRTALLRLLPFSLKERHCMGAADTIDDTIYSGFYPRILDQRLEPRQSLGDYYETYVERDVRQLGEIRNPSSFRRFVRLCAGRVGQLINLSSLGSDAGVSHTTARQWLTVLETSYIVFQLPPFFANIRKRLVKAPKLYFYDVGLASYLIGIENAGQVTTHPLRGALFENLIVSEALKYRFNRGREFNLSFFRDSRGLECDLFYETGRGIHAIEIKSGATVSSDFFASLNRVAGLVQAVSGKTVVYGGAERQSRTDCEVVPVADLAGVLERFELNQEISASVNERKWPAPDESDVNVLDDVYRTYLRPTLDGLDSMFAPMTSLFHTSHQISYVAVGNSESNSSGFFMTERWERTKSKYIVGQGFKLGSDRLLKLWHEYHFNGYTGIGGNEFDLVLTVEWKLARETVSQDVMVNGMPIPDLAAIVPYSELDTKSAVLGHTIAEISNLMMTLIDALSSG